MEIFHLKFPDFENDLSVSQTNLYELVVFVSDNQGEEQIRTRFQLESKLPVLMNLLPVID